MIADIETLRRHLGVARWLVVGGSWGSTLALAYAARHGDCITGMVLNSIATTTPWEIDWITRGVGMFFPQAHERFLKDLSEAERLSPVAAYYRRLINPDPAVHQAAAQDWCAWEEAIVATHPAHKPHPRWQDPSFCLAFARLVTHVWHHGGWLEESELLRAAGKLGSIPAVLVHGRLDLCNPAITPWTLHRNWPDSQLLWVNEAGHSSADPGMAETIAGAIADIEIRLSV